ncbi:LemA family protein [Nocardia stercoris]|uniref:LemA family protein n=1 Tax=Nocardia stercoris TaxID=2483361 RepID=A0A3M2LDB8_9NOCA|nr:LemA family protein [Nocardia stercoris]RMI35394.1 LemA family protein [Nocardia stercoris]
MSTTAVVVTMAIVALVAVLWYFSVFNSFVRLRNLVDESWQQVDIELRRRHDLVPNLVATVERAASFERETLEAVIAARGRAESVRGTANTDEIVEAENALSAALGRLQALAEHYPALSAVRNYAALQTELSDTEDRIAASRRLYNANVRALNTKIGSLPAAVVATLHRVEPGRYYEVDAAAVRDVVDVDRLWRRRAV